MNIDRSIAENPLRLASLVQILGLNQEGQLPRRICCRKAVPIREAKRAAALYAPQRGSRSVR
jgi:hypothetical protein